MKVEELRLGNYVAFDQGMGRIVELATKKYEEWSTGEDEHLRVISLSNGTYYACTEEELKPIPLTEELLIKAGFVENEDYEFPSFDEYIHKQFTWFGIGDFNQKYWLIHMLDQASGDGGPQITSVHHLQNIFFAITGHELEISNWPQ